MEKHLVPWGIEPFDNRVGGLPAHVLNVVETVDHSSGLLALGHFLWNGLENGERCVVVTSENPLSFIESFENWNMKFSKHLNLEDFVFLNYRPNVSMEIGLAPDYGPVFDEIYRLAQDGVHRIAIHQMDTLFNLNNPMLINNCAYKISTATANSRATILGQFMQFRDEVHKALRVACIKTMSGYFTVRSDGKTDADVYHTPYSLHVDRVPWFESVNTEVPLSLVKGIGFRSRIEQDVPKAA